MIDHPSAHPRQLPPVAVTLSFVDCINRLDHDGLVDLITDHHALLIFEEPPIVGPQANAVAWRGYFDAFPNYVVHPRQNVANGDMVAVLGHTTLASHAAGNAPRSGLGRCATVEWPPGDCSKTTNRTARALA